MRTINTTTLSSPNNRNSWNSTIQEKRHYLETVDELHLLCQQQLLFQAGVDQGQCHGDCLLLNVWKHNGEGLIQHSAIQGGDLNPKCLPSVSSLICRWLNKFFLHLQVTNRFFLHLQVTNKFFISRWLTVFFFISRWLTDSSFICKWLTNSSVICRWLTNSSFISRWLKKNLPLSAGDKQFLPSSAGD